MSTNTYLLDKSICDWWFAGQPTGQPILKTVEEWCKSENADLCFNLAEFNMVGTSKNLSCCEVIAQGRRISYGYGSFTDLLYINEKNACRGYSYGIRDGVVKVTRPKSGKRTRNGVGITTSGNLIISQSSDKITETTLCNNANAYVKERKQTVKLFLLEDGGGSTTSYSNIVKLGFNPEPDSKGVMRKVATVLCVRFKRPITFSHPLYVGCPKDKETELMQIILSGLQADRDYGNLSKNRMASAQKALGMPTGMQTGAADYSTLKKMGFAISF